MYFYIVYSVTVYFIIMSHRYERPYFLPGDATESQWTTLLEFIGIYWNLN